MTSPITTHVLDTTQGKPAMGIPIALERLDAAGRWTELARGVTDADGRIRDLLPAGHVLAAGTYRMSFETAAYFEASGVRGFYPSVPVVFELHQPAEHYHIPLLLSPYGYSTYRGS